MKNAFDQKKFDAIVKKAFEAAPDQSRESLTKIAQDLMQTVNRVHNDHVKMAEELEKNDTIKQYHQRVKELEKQLDNARNKLKQQERAKTLYNTLGSIRDTFTTHIKSAIDICVNTKDKLISTMNYPD